MENLEMYCLTIHDNHSDLIEKIDYIPVGLGDKIKSNKFIRDNTKTNISYKNPYYGEYTFHYWLWKNKINLSSKKWIGFCQYRKFWINNLPQKKPNNFSDFSNILLKNIPKDLENYDVILGEPLFVNQFKLSKFFKKNLLNMLINPILFFDKNKRNLKFHFDLMHGSGNLSKAINLLDDKEKKDFNNFLENSVSFNPHNMFICKSQKILINYYESLFPWLERCEKEFGFELKGYGLRRIYGFLAERYMSFWFQKYTNYKTMPIFFKDISEYQ